MNTAASSDPRIQHVRVTEDEIIAQLADGRVISVPLAWSWRLSEATPGSGRTSVSLAPAKACTGLTSTRTSASRACFTEFQRVGPGQR